MSTREIACICDKPFEAEIPDEVDLSVDSGQIGRILSGEFLVLSCPNCGKRLAPEFPIRFVHPASGSDFLMIPEEDRSDFYRGQYAIPEGFQCVIGYPELVERLRVLRDGLDLRAVEALKFALQAKAEESAPDADPLVSYHDTEGGDLTFLVSGMVEGKVGKVKAPRAQYDRVLADMAKLLGTEPYATFLKPPYICVKRLEAEA